MAGKIHLLPSELIDRIAAGEVVERPASALKELLENSLDAGARNIQCQIEDGGRALIRVSDDGEGMSREDLELSVVRHATSKLRTPSDLDAIRTLGFRGEALASLAAVARLRIVSRRPQDEMGWELVCQGGEPPRLREAGTAAGTLVEVSDLFFNTPARRKFLRSAATELTHIQAWMVRLALMAPGVRLQLHHGKRLLLEAPVAAEFAQRAAAVLGREVFEHLHPFSGRDGDFVVDGLVGDPDLLRGSPRDVFVFVNGRFVRDRVLQHAILSGYRSLMPPGRYPVVVARLALPPEEVDVNVHPQKLEVRFADGDRIHRLLSGSVSQALAGSPWLSRGRSYVIRRTESAPEPADAAAAGVREAMQRYLALAERAGKAIGASAGAKTREPLPSPAPAETGRDTEFGRYLGALWQTFLVFEDGPDMVLIDQHALHERISFERLRARAEQGGVSAQRLLVPLDVETSAALFAAFSEHREKLAELGFEAEPFGERALRLLAAPAEIDPLAARSVFLEVLGELSDLGHTEAWEEARLDILARMACHASVRAGQALAPAEVRALVAEMKRTEFSSRCPHGRPVVTRWTRAEVEKWFQRR